VREQFVDAPPARPEPPPPAPAQPPREFAEVSAWQPVVLNGARSCAGCGRAMRRGDPAYLGLGAASGGQPVICEPCLEREGDS